MKGKLIEFQMPKGFTLPEGSGSGDQFQELSTFRVKSSGKLCLVAVGDHKLPGYKMEGETEETPMASAGDKAAGRYSEMMGGTAGAGTAAY